MIVDFLPEMSYKIDTRTCCWNSHIEWTNDLPSLANAHLQSFYKVWSETREFADDLYLWS
jgi:hypothetical protein